MNAKSDTRYTLLKVRVQPKASRNAIKLEESGVIRVALTAAPVDGEANMALREFLAKALRIPRGAVDLVSGEKSREKVLRLEGLTGSEVLERLKKP
ncbi:MAG: DUF167 domain-containing protein [Candidatus Hydrogenedentes bacterium]|nr:DUF167 domain-containing protein [Candidatus Hydrogenedentota bacterium]